MRLYVPLPLTSLSVLSVKKLVDVPKRSRVATRWAKMHVLRSIVYGDRTQYNAQN